jgi:hypothetical protein
VKNRLVDLVWKGLGAEIKFYTNLIPVSIDMATYINAFTDSRPDSCADVNALAITTRPPSPGPTITSAARPSITPIPIGGVVGTYVNQANPNEYLELRSDGTFYLKEYGMDIGGKWEVKGNDLRLSFMGFVVTGEIQGNRIKDHEGKIWVLMQTVTHVWLNMKSSVVLEDTGDLVVFEIAAVSGAVDLSKVKVIYNDSSSETRLQYNPGTSPANGQWVAMDFASPPKAVTILAAGQSVKIKVNLATPITANQTFALQLTPPSGGVLIIERTAPALIDKVTDLH